MICAFEYDLCQVQVWSELEQSMEANKASKRALRKCDLILHSFGRRRNVCVCEGVRVCVTSWQWQCNVLTAIVVILELTSIREKMRAGGRRTEAKQTSCTTIKQRELSRADGVKGSLQERNTNLCVRMLLVMMMQMMMMMVRMLVLMMRVLILMMVPHHQRPMVTQVRIGILVHGMVMMLPTVRATGTAQGQRATERTTRGRLAGQQILYLSFVSAMKSKEI